VKVQVYVNDELRLEGEGKPITMNDEELEVDVAARGREFKLRLPLHTASTKSYLALVKEHNKICIQIQRLNIFLHPFQVIGIYNRKKEIDELLTHYDLNGERKDD